MKIIIKIYYKILNFTFYGIYYEIYSKFYIFLYKKFNKLSFSSNNLEKSRSDDGLYIAFINKALLNKKYFDNFKRNPIYRGILEHVYFMQGLKYLEITQRDNPELIKNINKYLENDKVGNPIKFYYKLINEYASPTTLRYLKIVSDIATFFGDKFEGNICEIGAGYGGQYLLLDKKFKFKSYTMIDLPDVNELIKKYLNLFSTRSKYLVSNVEKCKNLEYDFFISNYGFSELSKKLQIYCLEVIISKSKNGYMIMNSGKLDSVYKDHISLTEIKKYIPSLEVISEEPLTHEGNYTIIWKS